MLRCHTVAVFLCLAVLVGCATGERLAFPIREGWKIGNIKEIKGQYQLIEIVPEDETVHNWTKIFSVQNFPLRMVPQKTLEAFMNDVKKIIERDCPNVVWNVIQRGQNDILYEWRIENCSKDPDQHEVSRIIDGKWNRWHIAYASRIKKLPEEERDAWIKILAEAKIVEE